MAQCRSSEGGLGYSRRSRRDSQRCARYRTQQQTNRVITTAHLGVTQQYNIPGQLPRPSSIDIQQQLQQRNYSVVRHRQSTTPTHHQFTPPEYPCEEEVIQHVLTSHLLQHHGQPLSTKAEGVYHIIYENCIGLRHTIANNHKLLHLTDIAHRLEADVIGLTETQINFKHRKSRHSISDLFQREVPVYGKASHNVHESVGVRQEGGMATIAYNNLASHANRSSSGVDSSGLGRWSYISFKTAEHHVTKVLTAYAPCRSKSLATRLVYQQHRRYLITHHKNRECPRKKFRQDLLRQLRQWRAAGDRVILLMDMNDNIYTSGLGQDLVDPAGLGFNEVVQTTTGEQIEATYFQGSQPIDGIWASPDLEILAACVYPVGFGVGDHRLFAVNVTAQSLIGASPP